MNDFVSEQGVKFFIYHPSSYVGGSEVLFAKLALLIVDQLGGNVSIIDCPDNSAIKKVLSERAAEFIFLNANDDATYSGFGGAIVIASARNILNLYSRLPGKGEGLLFKPFFWLLHPAELHAQIGVGHDSIKRLMGYKWLRFFCLLNPGRRRFCCLIEQLNSNGSLFFMDDSSLRESEWVLNYRLSEPRHLRLYSGLTHVDPVCESRVERNNFVLISRLDSFKVPGIYKFLEDLDTAYKNNNWAGCLTVVGSGDAKTDLINFAEKLSYQVDFQGHVSPSEIRNILVSGRYGLLAGMGLSILEGASVGIPCLLLPASSVKIVRDDVYTLLGTREYHTLGQYVDAPFSGEASNLSSILKELEQDWLFCRQLSVDFFIKNYSVSRWPKRFLSVASEVKNQPVYRIGFTAFFFLSLKKTIRKIYKLIGAEV